MDYGGKKCFRCINFRKYYTRGVTKFNGTKFGWCSGKAASVVNTDCCDEFHPRRNRPMYMDMLQIQLNNLLTDISAVRQIIEEDNDDKEM